MGALLGVPEWVEATAFVVAWLLIWIGIGFLILRHAHEKVAARRANPAEAGFLALMAADCSPEAARFMWEQVLLYVEPRLTPHPDDLLIDDLCIDGDDIGMDWPRGWAERRGLAERDFPDWPESWPLTVRNFGRWLDRAAGQTVDPSAAG